MRSWRVEAPGPRKRARTEAARHCASFTRRASMNLATTYLGLKLAHPLISGASPLVDDLDMVRRLEDAGVAAITMHSLFEEQLAEEEAATWHHVEAYEQAS